MEQLKTTIKNERGVSSLAAILIVLVMGITGALMVRNVSYQASVSSGSQYKVKEKVAASSALEIALGRLNQGYSPETFTYQPRSADDPELVKVYTFRQLGASGAYYQIQTRPNILGATYGTVTAIGKSGVNSATKRDTTETINAAFARNCIQFNPNQVASGSMIEVDLVKNSNGCNDISRLRYIKVKWSLCGGSVDDCQNLGNVYDMTDEDPNYRPNGIVLNRINYQRRTEVFNPNWTAVIADAEISSGEGVKLASEHDANLFNQDGTYRFRFYFDQSFIQAYKMSMRFGFADGSIINFDNQQEFPVQHPDDDGLGAPPEPFDCNANPNHPECIPQGDGFGDPTVIPEDDGFGDPASYNEGDGFGDPNCDLDPNNPSCPDQVENDGIGGPDCDADPSQLGCNNPDPVDEPDCDNDPNQEGCAPADPCFNQQNSILCYNCVASRDPSDACKPYKEFYPPVKTCNQSDKPAFCESCKTNPKPPAACDAYSEFVSADNQEGGGALQLR